MIVINFLLLNANAAKKLSTEDCIFYAWKHSPLLKKEQIDAENNILDELIAKSKLAFEVDLSSSYSIKAKEQKNELHFSKSLLNGTQIRLSGNLDPLSNAQNIDSSISAVISHRILGGDQMGETRNLIEKVLIDKTILLNRIYKKKRELAYQIQRSFYLIIRDYQSVSIQERRVQRAKKNLQHALEREKPQDIITAKIDVPKNEMELIRANRGIEQRLDDLKGLMGMPIQEKLEIKTDFEYLVYKTDLEKDIQFAFNYGEDFLNNRLELKKLNADKHLYQRKLSPEVSLSAKHTNLNSTSGYNQEKEEQILSLDLSWQIGRKKEIAEFRKSLNRIRKNETDLFLLKQDKTKSLYDLHRRLVETEQSIHLQDQRIGLIGKQVVLFQDRWANGEIDILELVRSQNSLEDANVNLINLKAEYLELVAEYKFQVGRG